MTAVAKATSETEAVLKEDSAEETDINGGSGETKEVDLMTVANVSAEAVYKEYSAEKMGTDFESGETGAVLKEDSAGEIDTDNGSGEIKEVKLMTVAKATAETETVLK